MDAHYPPSMEAPPTFFKTDSRCFLVIPEWRQAAFRHEGRSDTCRYNAVTAQHNLISSPLNSLRYLAPLKQMHLTLGSGRKGRGKERDGEHWAFGCVTLRKRSAGMFKELEAPKGIRAISFQTFQVLSTCLYTWSSMSDRRGETTSVRQGLRWA
jgi:hypothetical protein